MPYFPTYRLLLSASRYLIVPIFAVFTPFAFAVVSATDSVILSQKIAEKLQPKIAIVLNSGEASVSLIDIATKKVIKTIPVGK